MKNQLQSRVLKKYQETFPDQTLRTIAKNTGINISRVFRLFNGYEMKISELEKFEETIQKKKKLNFKYSNFIKMAETCYMQLENNQLERIMEEMELTLYCFPRISQKSLAQKGA